MTNPPHSSIPIVYPEELVGKTIGIMQEDGQSTQIRIIEAVQEHQDATNTSNVKFRCNINDEAYDDILPYNQVMEYMAKNDDIDIVWKFKDIVGHQGSLNKSHKDYNGWPYNLTVLW